MLPPSEAVNRIVELPDLGAIPSNLWLYSPGSVSAICLKMGCMMFLTSVWKRHYSIKWFMIA